MVPFPFYSRASGLGPPCAGVDIYNSKVSRNCVMRMSHEAAGTTRFDLSRVGAVAESSSSVHHGGKKVFEATRKIRLTHALL